MPNRKDYQTALDKLADRIEEVTATSHLPFDYDSRLLEVYHEFKRLMEAQYPIQQSYDDIYDSFVHKVIKEGYSDQDQKVRTKWADGTPAHTLSLISEKITIPSGMVPLLTKKRVAWKSAIHEMLWFYVHRTSQVAYLDENNVKIWKEWTRDDDTIGRAYGHQLGKLIRTGETSRDPISGHLKFEYTNQVKRLIDELKFNAASRRHVVTLWSIEDLWDMSLAPCFWHSQWIVKEGTLHGIVGSRSNDWALGNPFNVFQYHVLHRMLCQVTGLKIGELTFNINDLHIYDRHIEPLIEQTEKPAFPTPKLWVNPLITDFDQFTIDDFELVSPEISDSYLSEMNKEEAVAYRYYEHGERIPMEVAI